MKLQAPKQKSDHERRLERIAKLEARVPAIKKISQHPKHGHWFPVFITILEVGGGIVFVLFIVPILIRLLPDISVPTPNINLPSIPFPTINLPQITIDLPSWLATALDWLFKTLPIWIAIVFAIVASRRNTQPNNNADKTKK